MNKVKETGKYEDQMSKKQKVEDGAGVWVLRRNARAL